MCVCMSWQCQRYCVISVCVCSEVVRKISVHACFMAPLSLESTKCWASGSICGNLSPLPHPRQVSGPQAVPRDPIPWELSLLLGRALGQDSEALSLRGTQLCPSCRFSPGLLPQLPHSSDHHLPSSHKHASLPFLGEIFTPVKRSKHRASSQAACGAVTSGYQLCTGSDEACKLRATENLSWSLPVVNRQPGRQVPACHGMHEHTPALPAGAFDPTVPAHH